MSKYAKDCCGAAIAHINAGNPEGAIVWLRAALQQTHNRRAWSRIMLAIRELNRLLPAA